MRISPFDIRQQQFSVKMFRGLDPSEVDAFLEDVAEDYEAVIKENAALREQLAAHEERARGLTEIERTLKETLVTTQRLAEEMKLTAKREADEMKLAAKRETELLVRDAELQGEKLLAEARAEEARLRSGIRELERRRRQVVEDLRMTLERYQRLFGADLEGAAADADATPGK